MQRVQLALAEGRSPAAALRDARAELADEAPAQQAHYARFRALGLAHRPVFPATAGAGSGWGWGAGIAVLLAAAWIVAARREPRVG